MKNENLNQDRFVRMHEMNHIIGVSKSTIHRLIKKRDFPKRFRISEGSVGCFEADIRDWMRQREVVLE